MQEIQNKKNEAEKNQKMEVEPHQNPNPQQNQTKSEMISESQEKVLPNLANQNGPSPVNLIDNVKKIQENQ